MCLLGHPHQFRSGHFPYPATGCDQCNLSTCSPAARSAPSTSAVTICQWSVFAGDRGQRIGMIAVAVLQNPDLRRRNRGNGGRIRRQLRLPQPRRPGESANEQRPPAASATGGNRRNRHTSTRKDAPPETAPSAPHRPPARQSRHRHPRRGLRIASSAGPHTITEQRGSARRCRVCSDSFDSSSSTDRSGAQAGVTSEANGWPPSRSSPASPDRAARSSCGPRSQRRERRPPYFVHLPSSMRHNCVSDCLIR